MMRFALAVVYPLFFILCASQMHAHDFRHPYNHYSGNTITKIAVIGERCSGTKFTVSLMKENFPHCHLCHNWMRTHNEYAHKHFFPWIKLEAFGICEIDAVSDLSFLANSWECLFIFIVREIDDWLRSFYLSPYESHISLRGKGLYHFISSEWSENGYDPAKYDRWNPYQSRPFKNLLELRKYKILNYLQIGLNVPNFLIVRYEDVDQHREQLIEFIAANYGMAIPEICKGKPYKRKKYLPFTQEEIDFINENTDWEVEAYVGYSKKSLEKAP